VICNKHGLRFINSLTKKRANTIFKSFIAKRLYRLVPFGLRSKGFFFLKRTRVVFLVDGFNLYHSILDASKNKDHASCKWLNIHALCESYLHLIGNNAQVEDIYYFTAYANHLTNKHPGKVINHKNFVKALQSTGIKCIFGRFKSKKVYCNQCNKLDKKHEEKETDVAIAVKIIELGHLNKCDSIIILSGDTDLAPAVKTFKILFPKKEIYFLFPYNRKNQELEDLSKNNSFTISLNQYRKFQFDDEILLTNGKKLKKPEKW